MKLFGSGVVKSHDESLMLLVARAKTPAELRRAQKAFEELYTRWKGPIMSYLYQMTQDHKLAEDLVQEVFLKVFRARERYEVTAKFSTWLWTIARHAALDEFKKKKESLALENSEESELADDSTPVDERLIEALQDSWIQECLEKLSPRSREIVNLRIFSEESYEAIAQATGEKLSSVKTILFRAKAALVECFQAKRGKEP